MQIIENQTTSSEGTMARTIIIRERHRTNGLGTAGFVLALIALFISWIPVLGWIIWLLGLIFSFFGLFKRPAGLAVAGFILSLAGFVILVAFVGVVAALMATAFGIII